MDIWCFQESRPLNVEPRETHTHDEQFGLNQNSPPGRVSKIMEHNAFIPARVCTLCDASLPGLSGSSPWQTDINRDFLYLIPTNPRKVHQIKINSYKVRCESQSFGISDSFAQTHHESFDFARSIPSNQRCPRDLKAYHHRGFGQSLSFHEVTLPGVAPHVPESWPCAKQKLLKAKTHCER